MPPQSKRSSYHYAGALEYMPGLGRGEANPAAAPRYASPLDAPAPKMEATGYGDKPPQFEAVPRPAVGGERLTFPGFADGEYVVSPEASRAADEAFYRRPGAAPTPAGAGVMPMSFSLSDPMIGAGINIRDNPEIQAMKMQAKQQQELGALEAASRNQLGAGQINANAAADANQFLLGQQRAGFDREQAAATRDLADRTLAQTRDLAEMGMRADREKEAARYGPEAQTAALKTAIFRAMAENPEKADAIMGMARKNFPDVFPGGPVAAAPGGLAGPLLGAAAGAAPAAPAAPAAAATPQSEQARMDYREKLNQMSRQPAAARAAGVAELTQGIPADKRPAALAEAARQLADDLVHSGSIRKDPSGRWPVQFTQPLAGLDKPMTLSVTRPPDPDSNALSRGLGRLGDIIFDRPPFDTITLGDGTVIPYDPSAFGKEKGYLLESQPFRRQRSRERLTTSADAVRAILGAR